MTAPGRGRRYGHRTTRGTARRGGAGALSRTVAGPADVVAELLAAPVVYRDHHASTDGRRLYRETQLWRPERAPLGWVTDHPGPGPIGRGRALAHAADASRRLGAGGVVVVYLASLRVDDGPELPADALNAAAAAGQHLAGPDQLAALHAVAREAREVVCAWGELPIAVPALRLSAEYAAAGLLTRGAELRCLGASDTGLPIHPRAAGTTPPPLRSWPPLGPASLPHPIWRSA